MVIVASVSKRVLMSLLGLILMAESNASPNSVQGIFQGCSWQMWHYLNTLLQLEAGKTLVFHVSSKVITWLWVSTTFWKLLWCSSRIEMWDIKSCLKSETQSNLSFGWFKSVPNFQIHLSSRDFSFLNSEHRFKDHELMVKVLTPI